MHIIPGFEHLPRKFKTARLFIIIFGAASSGFFLICFLTMFLNSLMSRGQDNETARLVMPWMLVFIVMGLSFLFFGIRFPKIKRNKFKWFLLLSLLLDAFMVAYILSVFLLAPPSSEPRSQLDTIVIVIAMTITCLGIAALLLGFEIFVGKKIRRIERIEAEVEAIV